MLYNINQESDLTNKGISKWYIYFLLFIHKLSLIWNKIKNNVKLLQIQGQKNIKIYKLYFNKWFIFLNKF
jgi:hypothetical protein